LRRISYPTRRGCRSKTVTFKAPLKLTLSQGYLEGRITRLNHSSHASIHPSGHTIPIPAHLRTSRYRSHFLIPIPRMLFRNQTPRPDPPHDAGNLCTISVSTRHIRFHLPKGFQSASKNVRHNSETDFLLLLQTCTSQIPVSVTTAKTFLTPRRKKSRYIALTNPRFFPLLRSVAAGKVFNIEPRSNMLMSGCVDVRRKS
jgi:hypothetical protein